MSIISLQFFPYTDTAVTSLRRIYTFLLCRKFQIDYYYGLQKLNCLPHACNVPVTMQSSVTRAHGKNADKSSLLAATFLFLSFQKKKNSVFFFLFLTQQGSPLPPVTMMLPVVTVPCVHAKSLQLCPTFCKPMDHSLPGFSVHGILQARILE